MLILYGFLSAAAISFGISSLKNISQTLHKISRTFSAFFSGALLGFFYAGSASGNNPTAVIAGAIVAGLLMVFASSFRPQSWVKLTIATITTVTTYSIAFLLGATASIYLSAHQMEMGMIAAIASLVCV